MRGRSLGLPAGGKNCVPSIIVSCGRILEIARGLLARRASHPNAPGTGVLGYWGVRTHPLQDKLASRGQGGRRERRCELRLGRRAGGGSVPGPTPRRPGPGPGQAPGTPLRAARSHGFPTRAKGSAEGTTRGCGGLLSARERWTASHWLPSLRPRSPLATARAHGPSTLPRAAQRVACQGGATNGSACGAGPRTPGAPARASR